MEVYKAPPILMVHLKRFKGGGSFLSKGKITDRIDFPTSGMDIGKYILNHELPTDYPVERLVPIFEPATTTTTTTTEGDASTTNTSEIQENTQTTTPQQEESKTKSVKPEPKQKSETTSSDGKLEYDLFGVVNHYGNLGFGHYTAYAKNFKNEEWHQFDDSSVSKESPNGVCTPAAYVLFYKRRNWKFDNY